MTSKIILKKSSVAAKVPLVADLDYGELALNYADGKLYYKKSDNTVQQLNAAATGSGDMSKTTYDSNDDGIVNAADLAYSVDWGNITNTPLTFPPSTHNHVISDVTGLQNALDGKQPVFTVQNANSVFAGPITGSQALPSFRALVSGDIPTLNQNTTGSAGSLAVTHTIYGNSFNGTQDLTQIINSTYGGTGNGFTKFTGPTTSEKTFTLPDSSATILTSATAVTIAQGGTGQTSKTAAFDALSPLTTKGDLVVFDGTNNIRLPKGSDNLYLAADSSTASGLVWKSTLTDPVVYTANSLSLTNGVYVSGSVTDVQTYNDGNFYQITDGTLPGPAWIIDVTFNSVSSFNRLVANIDYTQNSGHTIYFQAYNNITSVWDNLGSYSGSTGYTQYAIAVFNDAPYISGGTVQIRFYHANQGSATHTTKLEYVALEQTTTGSQGPRGPAGSTGSTGAGVATGGTTGQYLRKSSSTNYDTAWSDVSISEITNLQTTLDGKEAAGVAAGLITTHEAAVDPHPQYTTLPEIAAVTKDIHGFIDRTSTTLSFNESTRTFTITPTASTWSVYILGNLKTITGSLSLQIPNATGGYFIRVNSAGTALEYVAGTPDFANDVYAVYIYWNSSTGKALIVGDERHGSQRDTTWHSNQHLNVGTVWRSGGAVSYTLNNASSVNIGFVAPIRIADEDLLHVINHSATPTLDYEQVLDTSAVLEVLYLDGTAYTTTTPSTSPWIAGTSTARYNQITAGSGTLVDAGEGKYITYWVLATNDIRRPVKLVLGRQAHSTIDAAYSETFTDYGISFAEQVFMHQIVVQTSTSYSNTAKVVIAAVRKIQEKLASSAVTYSAGAHSELTGRENADQHPISAITNLQTSLDGKQATLVSGTSIKTINSTSLLGSGDVAVQPTLVSGTNIKTINSTSLLGSGNVAVQESLVSGTNIKTINSTSLLGSGNVAVQESLVSGTNIKTINSISLLGSGDVQVQPTLVSGTSIKTINSTSLLGSGDVAVQPTLVSGTNIKTVNGTTLLGSGDLSVGTVTSVAALTIGTTGTDIGSTVATGTTTPVITLNIPTASATNRGALSSGDWSTFNSKQEALVSGTNIKTINGTSVLGSGNITVSAGAAGSTGNIQYNSGGSLAGSANLNYDVANNRLQLLGTDADLELQIITNEPTAPAAGRLLLYAKSIGGRILPKIVGPSGFDTALQSAFAQNKIAIYNPTGNVNTVPVIFGLNLTANGTATARNVATTNVFTRARRLGYVSQGTAGSYAGLYNVAASTQYTIGSGTIGVGGFYFVVRFGFSDAAAVATAIKFVGMTSTTAAPTVTASPATFTNSIGLGCATGDTNLSIFYGGSAAQTPIALGASFPAKTINTDWYELILFAPSNSNTTVSYRVLNITTNAVAEGTLTAAVAGTQLPLGTTLLGPRIYTSNNATATAVALDIGSIYLETDT